jgi:hypothetical protein
MVKQGDIIWLDFDPQAGHEQRGRRPAVVVSNDYFLPLPVVSKSDTRSLTVIFLPLMCLFLYFKKKTLTLRKKNQLLLK